MYSNLQKEDISYIGYQLIPYLEVLALVLIEGAVPAGIVPPHDGAEAEVPRAQRVLRQPP